MATYIIQVLNSSGFSKSYVLFMQPPQVTATGGQPIVYTNAWVTFSGIQPGGTDTVTYTDSTFAYWATATMPIAPGTTMGQSGVAAVDTTAQDSVPFIGTVPRFRDRHARRRAEWLVPDYRRRRLQCVQRLSVRVCAAWQRAEHPLTRRHLRGRAERYVQHHPVINFYVADGAYVPGQIIDYTAASTNAGTVSFTGKSQTNAVVTQGPNGLFTTQYY